MPSLILIYPDIWPQYINVTDRMDRQTTVWQHRAKCFTNCRPKTIILRVKLPVWEISYPFCSPQLI